MNKKVISMVVMSVLVTSMVGCGSKEPSEKPNTEGSVSVNKNFLNVEVTIPTSLTEIMGDGVIKKIVDEKEIKGTKVNADKSVTYEVSKSTHKKMLAELKKNIDGTIVNILKEKETFSSFKDVRYNDDATEFTVVVDKAKFNEMQEIGVVGFLVTGNMYQAVNGVSDEKINTVVKFEDSSTKEIIKTVDFNGLTSK